MKNKKTIIILIVLILLFLIGAVSANDINTTEEISVSTTDDVSSTVNVDSTDEKHVNDLTDESEDSNVLSISADENSTSMKDNEESNISNDVSYKSISNSQILGINNDNNILGDSSTTMSLELNSKSIKIIYNNLASTRSGSNTLNMEYKLDGRTYSESISVSNPTIVYDGGKTFYLFSGEYTISNVNLYIGSEVEVYLQLRNNPSESGVYMGSISLAKTVDLDVVINDQTFNYNSNGYQITGYASLFGEAITSDNTYFVYIDRQDYYVNAIGVTHYFSNGDFIIYIPNYYITLGSNTLYIFTKSTYYGPAVGSFTLTITKTTPTVSVSSASINYNTGTYSVSGTCSANGLTINLKAGSTSLGSATVSNGKWTVSGISSTKLNPGSYTLTATSTETDSYGSASATNTLTVSKSTPTVTVTDKNVNYNTGTYTLGGTVKVGSNNVGTGTVTIYKDGVQIGTASVSGGTWTSSAISSTLYDVGSYTITASYDSNTYYDANSGTGTLTISKVTPVITVSTAPDIKYGNGVYTVSGTAKYGSNNVDMGTITLKCGDTILGTGSVSGGLWTVSNIDTTLVDPSPNPYTITAYYENNVNYNSASAGNSLTVNKFTPDISIESTLIWYNQSNGGVLNGKVYTYNGDFYSGFIDLYVNGELVASDVSVSSNGIWTYTLPSTTNLAPGTYSVRVDWKGNEYTNNNTLTDNRYTVNKGMVIPLITSTGNIDIGRSEYVYVDVNNIMGGGYLSGMTVTLQGSGIDGILEEISDNNGRATFSVPNLMAGKYDDWKISVVSNDYYYPTMNSFNVGMFYVQYPLTVNITGISPNNSTYPEEIIITGFTDADQIPQGNVSLTIGGKTYTAFFDSNGNFTASLIGVKPGVYTNITAKYNPTVDEFYYRGVESTVSIPETRNDQKC